MKVGDLVRRRASDCVEGPGAPRLGLIIKIQANGRNERMIHVVFGNRIRRYSETYGACDLKVISESR